MNVDPLVTLMVDKGEYNLLQDIHDLGIVTNIERRSVFELLRLHVMIAQEDTDQAPCFFFGWVHCGSFILLHIFCMGPWNNTLISHAEDITINDKAMMDDSANR